MHRAERTAGFGEAADAVAFVSGVLGEAGGNGDVGELLAALVHIRALREQLAEWEPRLIDQARGAGASWARLAPALGVASRQAAERKYLRINQQTTDPAMTGEQRIQATRDRRASDRAVASWARDNAADLRRLAGQVTALDGLDRTTQKSVDRVHDALGDNDSVALLGPLADAGPRLARDHPGLANRISELGERTDEVRQHKNHSPG
ncbi:hypothetical protein F1D05_38365 [Kribbella qitaiheensis]|uniref:HSP18 transcriptional regulator n=1 Tax=Kribbella qitaiheensis TaxID=1544730 RepID=A0A7G6X8Y0_9ACTN|nr:hypothetical protein [Kribbella qitaiheensis]QNE22695.1 hypothetical protein F1D05_38365 [Kribbella qitaiheensis]